MLSIGKLAAGQAIDYLSQADGRVDAVEGIGVGLEKYYAGGAEARGTWIGAAATTLGLLGEVDGSVLRRVLAALHPQYASPLRGASSAVRAAGV